MLTTSAGCCAHAHSCMHAHARSTCALHLLPCCRNQWLHYQRTMRRAAPPPGCTAQDPITPPPKSALTPSCPPTPFISLTGTEERGFDERELGAGHASIPHLRPGAKPRAPSSVQPPHPRHPSGQPSPAVSAVAAAKARNPTPNRAKVRHTSQGRKARSGLKTTAAVCNPTHNQAVRCGHHVSVREGHKVWASRECVGGPGLTAVLQSKEKSAPAK